MWILDELKKRKDDPSPAIVYREERTSFAELWTASEQIGTWMETRLKTMAPVVIFGNKDPKIVEIMIAALKSGRAYIPIDVTFPPERVKKIVEITACEMVFNLSDMPLSFNGGTCEVIGRESLAAIKCSQNSAELDESLWVNGDDNCYMLFTSGSTGDPKGVQISKNNILNFVNWFARYAQVEGDTVLNQVSYSFDVSVIQLYIYLASGKTLFCVGKEMIEDFGLLFHHLKESRISSWVSTPAFIEMCAVYDSFDRSLLPKLEKIILAGETLTKKLVSCLWSKFPGVEVINGYGPTEGTVLLTCCTITDKMMADNTNELPIGYLIDGAEFTIDRQVEARTAADDCVGMKKGELVVSSQSISKGYFRNPQATAKSFSFPEDSPWPTYRTGDIVYMCDGLIYFCGRKDFQIKLNGYRIELDDISENVNKIDVVSNNVILPVYKDGKVSYIAAFVCLNRDLGLSAAKTTVFLRKELAKLVPSYMVPKKIIVLDCFPLNVNGKIDRKLLAERYL